MDHEYRDASNSPSAWAPAPPEAWGPLGDAPLASSGQSRGDGGAPEAAGGLFGGLYDDAVARVCREPSAPVPAKPPLLPKDGPPDRSFLPGKHLPSGPAAPEDGMAKFAAENPVKAKLLETLGVSGALTVKAGMQEGADKRAVAERGADRVAAEKIAADRSAVKEGGEKLGKEDRERGEKEKAQEARKGVKGPVDVVMDAVIENQRRR